MSTNEGVQEKSGLSRRDLIKKGAVAGAIVWTLPMIESVPAYAATGSTSTGNFCGASYAFVIYKNTVTEQYYWASFIKASTTCGGQSTNHCNYSDTTISGTTTLGHLNGIDGSTIQLPYSNGSASASVNGTDLGAQNCVGVTQSGNTITAISNTTVSYEIVAAVAFGTSVHCHSTNTGDGLTINGSGAGNSVNISFEVCT